MRAFLAAALVCALPFAAQAQEAPKIVSLTVVPEAPIDAARLAAARAFLDVIMPPEGREKMFEGVVTQMMGTMLAGLQKGGGMEGLGVDDPRVRAVVARFVERQHRRSLDLLRGTLPQLMAAYANAYARNFTLDELTALTTFFGSPVGRRYAEKAPALLADPDVSAWMQNNMAESRKALPEALRELKEELAPLLKEEQHAS